MDFRKCTSDKKHRTYLKWLQTQTSTEIKYIKQQMASYLGAIHKTARELREKDGAEAQEELLLRVPRGRKPRARRPRKPRSGF